MPNVLSRAKAAHLIDPLQVERICVLGPTIEFLTPRDEKDGPCIMRGTLPPGGFVPLHSHADPETFVVMEGAVEGLARSADRFEWIPVGSGAIFHVPPNAMHAWRNPGRAPALMIVISTSRMGEFFREIGKPMSSRALAGPPTPQEIQHFLETSERYGYWNATPEENARVGLSVPPPAGVPER